MKKGQKKGTHLNLLGNKYGKLTVIGFKFRDNKKRYIWACRCNCGKMKDVPQDLLTSGRTKSCGCLLKECRYVRNKYPDRTNKLFNTLYSPIKKRHKKLTKNENYISFDEFKKLSISNCFYCNRIPSQIEYDIRYGRKGNKRKIIISDTTLLHNGLDRIDSTKGYEKNNVVPCCYACNLAKNKFNIDEFKSNIKLIYEHWASK